MKSFNFFIYTASILLFAGCAVPKSAEKPAKPLPPDAYRSAKDTTAHATPLVRSRIFTDTALLALIDTAVANNPDYLLTAQKLERSAITLYRRKAAFLPAVEAVASAGATRYGDYTIDGVGNFDTNLSGNINDKQRTPTPFVPDYFLGLRSNWEIDVWGKLKALKASAASEYLSLQAARQMVRTELVSQVAALYFELLAKDNELGILEKNIKLQQTAVEIIKIQKTGGRATELAVQQFQAQLLRTQAAAFMNKKEINALENQLCSLIGTFPHRINRGRTLNKQSMSDSLTAGVPSGLLENRPDIRQRAHELEAFNKNLEAARLSFLPSFTITPYAGLRSFKAGLLFSPESAALGLLGNIAAPVFNRRMLKADLKMAQIRWNEAWLDYRKTLLNAVEEVSSQLYNMEALAASYRLKEQEFMVLNNGVSTANDLFLGGYANYLEVITAQRNVLETELELTKTKKEMLLAQVYLYRALGGN